MSSSRGQAGLEDWSQTSHPWPWQPFSSQHKLVVFKCRQPFPLCHKDLGLNSQDSPKSRWHALVCTWLTWQTWCGSGVCDWSGVVFHCCACEGNVSKSMWGRSNVPQSDSVLQSKMELTAGKNKFRSMWKQEHWIHSAPVLLEIWLAVNGLCECWIFIQRIWRFS